MATPLSILAASQTLAAIEGAAVVFYAGSSAEPSLRGAAAEAETLTGGQLTRAIALGGSKRGEATVIPAPQGVAASHLVAVALGEDEDALDPLSARALGGGLAGTLAGTKAASASVFTDGLLGAMGDEELAASIALGARLKSYRFDARKSANDDDTLESLTVATADPAAFGTAWAPLLAYAEGIEFTRDLVNEPANVLTPTEFASRVEALSAEGLIVEVLGEKELEELGMRTLLAVGYGSEQESKVAIMRWQGADDPNAAPVALVGKGVIFDTGGISLKPAAGMEDMTMDMGGAGVVSGAMLAIAKRKSKANVIGILGLVENMPDGRAQRPGDIVTSMAGKTVEVINTDAEGRLVLADVLWHVQEVYKPRGIVDLATLTGAMIIALGHDYAGYFANDDDWAAALASAAEAEGENLWRLPLADSYDKLLKSRLADMKNVGGRAAGSITAAQFLQRFIQDGQAWAHIDIAGVCVPAEPGPLAPKGPSGWGVMTLVRLAEDSFAPSA
ncbi:MAG: leucyl aminopeptidase [Pseudomonadota bacterium]